MPDQEKAAAIIADLLAVLAKHGARVVEYELDEERMYVKHTIQAEGVIIDMDELMSDE